MQSSFRGGNPARTSGEDNMKLFIDTTNSHTIAIGIDGKIYETKARQDKSQKLLTFIEKLLRKNNKKLKDISEIAVENGPGSFTGLRVGVSVAQTLGWALGVKVNGKNLRMGETVDIKYN
jgi:tRNA threonylcarbamoyladenosine biosynthesis protein TsaB